MASGGVKCAGVVGLMLACALGAATASFGESEGEQRVIVDATKRKRYAVCVVGAVRSMMQQDVVSGFHDNIVMPWIADGRGDLFYHVFVGEELSARGQATMTVDDAGPLAKALQNATRFRLQFDENPFTCEQQTTGKFYKIAQCAHMVQAYALETGTEYETFVFVRPDFLFQQPLKLTPPALPAQPWLYLEQYADCDCVAANFSTGIAAALALPAAECCDTQIRRPPACFLSHVTADGSLLAPKPNFIFERHLNTFVQQARAHEGYASEGRDRNGGAEVVLKVTGRLVRTKHQTKIMRKFTVYELHGKVRPHVRTPATPRMSHVTSWGQECGSEGGAECRAEVMRQLLADPAGSTAGAAGAAAAAAAEAAEAPLK